ncbi:hypothetical protein A2997_00040 [Candidatus Nomurabacteria bacterium RIFCSPLOWO2_01_FULL_36_10b]|uniref:Uncharacterized protein n=1 Tax=Candidatus Nomurabacteria bacterium RIFCSPLOWO2_01_FULL_36_10b TaxID=1801766 RepID=A0A1F6WPZ6_9BACT|nr:MAG: hypothetical protein A2997_00040 [Candidatus Nomurabacteria bacterium RIFCSPLOWO2_01_FULL_36_10b]
MAISPQPHAGKLIGRVIAIVLFVIVAVIIAVLIMRSASEESPSDQKVADFLRESTPIMTEEEQSEVTGFIQNNPTTPLSDDAQRKIIEDLENGR